MKKQLIEKAIDFATSNRVALQQSDKAGCYYCKKIYNASLVTNYLESEETALCPKCGIDSVIPSKSPIELTPRNLADLNKHWF